MLFAEVVYQLFIFVLWLCLYIAVVYQQTNEQHDGLRSRNKCVVIVTGLRKFDVDEELDNMHFR